MWFYIFMWIYVATFSFMCGVFIFFMSNKYFIINLLSLEFISVNVFCIMYLFLMFKEYQLFFCMLFITFIVCEGVVGVSMLIMMVRSVGNSFFSSMLLMKC